jgi:hypothetical protein
MRVQGEKAMKRRFMKKISFVFITVFVLAYILSVPTGIGHAQSLESVVNPDFSVSHENRSANIDWDWTPNQNQELDISLDQKNWYPLSWTPLSGKGSALEGVHSNQDIDSYTFTLQILGLKDDVSYYYRVVTDGTNIITPNVSFVSKHVAALWADQNPKSNQELDISMDGKTWTALSSLPFTRHNSALDGAYLDQDVTLNTTGVNVYGLTDGITYRFKLVVDGSNSTRIGTVTPDPIQVYYHVQIANIDMGGCAFYIQAMENPGVAQPPTPPTIDDCDFVGWYYLNPNYNYNLPGSKTNAMFLPWDMNTKISVTGTDIVALYESTIDDSRNSGITIRSNANVLNGATSMKVTPKRISDVTKNVSSANSKKYVIKDAFSIDLYNDENVKVEPNADIGKVKVILPSNIVSTLGKGDDLKNTAVVYISDNGKVTEMPTTVNTDGTISFKTTHFSTYALAKRKIAPVVASISMKSQPYKKNYIKGKRLDLTGAKITASYNNSTTRIVGVTLDMVSDYNPNHVGTQTITVTYNGKKTTFKVTVISPTAVPSLSVTKVAKNAVFVAWVKAPAASGYEIYRSTNGGKFSLIRSINSGNITSYKNSGLTAKRSYTYEVRSYKTVQVVTYKKVGKSIKKIVSINKVYGSFSPKKNVKF